MLYTQYKQKPSSPTFLFVLFNNHKVHDYKDSNDYKLNHNMYSHIQIYFINYEIMCLIAVPIVTLLTMHQHLNASLM